MNLPQNLHPLIKREKGKVPLTITAKKKPTNGQLFKAKHGISKTLKRNMTRVGLNPFDPKDVSEYKEMRKKRKLTLTVMRQKKHKDSTLYKRINGKKRTKGNPSGKRKKASTETGKKK